ncbi:hypothetical protein [Pedobacter flavus]|uniref:DUF4149 domain-containing protein n=1 Tax=Pedobacter flavus TaxID=3113906 RepID=A0ABU7H5D2_9SPHI|nr:hypothetical protein [Pedobacter sp. VNH31]MEE1885766.1 hypothetical protein [Pedobacter sp. VNH31]
MKENISTVKMPVAVICIFVWIGFLGAISFMEAWMKFQAPGITLPLGLGIGRMVFNALNKVEWVMCIAILINLIFIGKDFLKFKNITFLIPLVLLITQTLWLLPALDARAQLIIDGESVAPSNLHVYFVLIEGIKTICLFIFGVSLFKRAKSIQDIT